MSSTLNNDELPHSAGSSTRVSINAVSPVIEDIKAANTGSVQRPRLPIKDQDAQQTRDSSCEVHIPTVRTRTPSVTESERERIERERAVEAVSPRAEYHGKPTDEKEVRQEQGDPFLVVWDENDKENPKTWSTAYRWYLTTASSLLVFSATFASSSPSGVARDIAIAFNLTEIETTLAISLFITGYCVGPLAWGPLSEQYGRRPIFLISFGLFTVLQIACAVAPNGAALLVFRFLGGCFAAAPLTNSGAVLADIWDAETRGTAMAIFVITPFAGPALGPIVGGYVSVGGLHWTWLFWILSIFAGVCFIMLLFSLPETYAPILLVRKAAAKRRATGDERYKAALERQSEHWKARVQRILGRPFKVLFLEPLLLVLTIYMSYAYGILYMLFTAYPVIFTQGYGLNEGEEGLTFIPLFVGGVVGAFIYLFVFAPKYKEICAQHAPRSPPPEARLPMANWGGPMFIIAIFWLGWTSYPSISIWAPMMSGFLLGISLTFIFLALLNYTVDAYLPVAASALAASTVVRSLFGAAFPLFGNKMYTVLNPRIASTVLGAASLLLVPVPFLLLKWGPVLRKKSRYAMDVPLLHAPHTHHPVKDVEEGKGVKA